MRWVEHIFAAKMIFQLISRDSPQQRKAYAGNVNFGTQREHAPMENQKHGYLAEVEPKI
jgi:hypothetical protein